MFGAGHDACLMFKRNNIITILYKCINRLLVICIIANRRYIIYYIIQRICFLFLEENIPTYICFLMYWVELYNGDNLKNFGSFELHFEFTIKKKNYLV